jgi:hypothetical protein
MQYFFSAGPKYLLKEKKNINIINRTKVIAFFESSWDILYTKTLLCIGINLSKRLNGNTYLHFTPATNFENIL